MEFSEESIQKYGQAFDDYDFSKMNRSDALAIQMRHAILAVQDHSPITREWLDSICPGDSLNGNGFTIWCFDEENGIDIAKYFRSPNGRFNIEVDGVAIGYVTTKHQLLCFLEGLSIKIKRQ